MFSFVFFLQIMVDTLPTAFERLDEFASNDLGSYISSLSDVVNEKSGHRINAAKEIVRQLSSPSRFLLAAKKDEWLKVNEEMRNSIVTKVRFYFEMFE